MRLLEVFLFHRYGLEAFAVVTAFLHVSDWGAEEGGAVLLCHGEECYFIVKVDELLNDELLDIAAAAAHAVFPRMLQVIAAPDKTLALA